MEVECRTCLEMADLLTSSSITKKFLLGKSYKEVILLFVPQMVSAIWVDDIICCTCSKTLHAFAKIIEKCLATEIVLKKKSGNKSIWSNTNLDDPFDQNTVINTKLCTEDVPSDLCNRNEKSNIRLKPRPIQELRERPVQPRLKKTRGKQNYQCIDKCGVCLLEMSSLENSSRLTQQLLLGKTFKEVILSFLPFMVSAFWINDIICFNCANPFLNFAKFIERCIEVEEIFEKVNVKKGAEKTEEGDSQSHDIKKEECQPKSTQEHPNQSNFNYNIPIRTYIRKRKSNSVNQNAAQDQTVALFDKEKSTGPIAETVLNATNVAVSDAYEESTKPPVRAFVVDTRVSQTSSDNSIIHDVNDSVAKPLDNTRKEQVVQRTQQRRDSNDVTVINSLAAVSDAQEESARPPVRSFVIVTKAGQINSDKSTIKDINDANVKPLDEQIVKIKEQRSCDSDDVMVATNSSLIEQADTDSDTSCGGTDDELELFAEEENEAIDLTERFYVSGVPFYEYPIRKCDRIISIPQSETVLPVFLEALSTKLNIPIYHYGKPTAEMKNKRILLLGVMTVPCPICKIVVSSTALNYHLKMLHNQLETPEVPGSANMPSFNYTIRPHRKKDLPAVVDHKLYVYDHILKTNKGKKVFPCPVCNAVTHSTKQRMRHIHRVHKDFKPFKCEKCGKEFRHNSSFRLHVAKLQSFASCDVRKCSVCAEIVNKTSFAQHMKAHKMFTCDVCGASYASAASLSAHSKSHQHKKALKQLQLCSICGATPTSLRAHMKTHESRPRTYKCHKCHRAYMSQQALNTHLKKIHQNLQFVCNVCNKMCRSGTALREHNKLKHLKVVSHICKICGEKFTRGDYFRRHMRMHAEGRSTNRGGPRKYVFATNKLVKVECKYCLKICGSVGMLKLHLITHMKRIRYKCRICSITCSNPGNRLRHEKKHRDPNFELRCKICWTQLYTKEELDKHLDKHKKTRKYKCQYCGEGFSRKYLLSHHIAEEHTSKEDIEKEKQAVYTVGLKELLLHTYDEN